MYVSMCVSMYYWDPREWIRSTECMCVIRAPSLESRANPHPPSLSSLFYTYTHICIYTCIYVHLYIMIHTYTTKHNSIYTYTILSIYIRCIFTLTVCSGLLEERSSTSCILLVHVSPLFSSCARAPWAHVRIHAPLASPSALCIRSTRSCFCVSNWSLSLMDR